MSVATLFLFIGPSWAGQERLEPKLAETEDALKVLSGFSGAGWVSCPLPRDLQGPWIRTSDVSLRVIEGTNVAGLVETTSGVTVVKPRLDTSKCATDPDCVKTQDVERARGLFRWSGAEAGRKGTCVFEPAEIVEIEGKVVSDSPLADETVTVVGCEGVKSHDATSFTVTTVEGLPCTVSASTLSSGLEGETDLTPAPGASITVKLGKPKPAASEEVSQVDAALEKALATTDLDPAMRELFTRWKGERDEANARRAERMKELEALEAAVDALLKKTEQ